MIALTSSIFISPCAFLPRTCVRIVGLLIASLFSPYLLQQTKLFFSHLIVIFFRCWVPRGLLDKFLHYGSRYSDTSERIIESLPIDIRNKPLYSGLCKYTYPFYSTDLYLLYRLRTWFIRVLFRPTPVWLLLTNTNLWFPVPTCKLRLIYLILFTDLF